MADWDSAQYLKFEEQRTQPARDLAAAIPLAQAARVLDVGCGPGNSTGVLLGRFPGAELTGVDNSPAMLDAARAAVPAARFAHCDITGPLHALGEGWDVVFSNACLQWVPGHPALLSRLFSLLRRGGVLAVQLPLARHTRFHTVIQEVRRRPPFAEYAAKDPIFHLLPAAGYINLLAVAASSYRVWETSYYHIFPSAESILEWCRGTWLRPFMAAMPTELHTPFEAAVLAGAREAYPPQENGQVVFTFPRFFFVAEKE